MNDNYDESTGGKISVSDWDNNDRSWTSFIAKDDENKLAIDRSYVLNEITIKIKTADYSKVDEAIAKIPSNLSQYTDETVKALNDAKNAVIRDKNITAQTSVDTYAIAIEDAITGLKLKGQYNQSNKDNSTVAPNKTDNKIGQRENLPSTGDKTNLRLLAFMLIISG